jgi:hypothetical protein
MLRGLMPRFSGDYSLKPASRVFNAVSGLGGRVALDVLRAAEQLDVQLATRKQHVIERAGEIGYRD